MLIGVAKETWPGEVRTALVPANATKLIKSGFSIAIQAGAGTAAGFTDESYADAGVTIMNSRAEVLAAADIFLQCASQILTRSLNSSHQRSVSAFLTPITKKL